ncbi:MAG: VOC family protein [Puniceicoccales bacterium]
MSDSVNPVPPQYGTLTPSLNLSDAKAASKFYQAAFDAVELFAMECPSGSGKVMHGEMKIGDTIFFFCDETEDWGAVSPLTVGGCPLSLNLYVPDCDAVHAQAVAAGATVEREPTSYPWGERSSMVKDPFGYRWAICTHIEDVSPEEVMRRLQEWAPGE